MNHTSPDHIPIMRLSKALKACPQQKCWSSLDCFEILWMISETPSIIEGTSAIYRWNISTSKRAILDRPSKANEKWVSGAILQGDSKPRKLLRGSPLDIVASFSIRDRYPIVLLDIWQGMANYCTLLSIDPSAESQNNTTRMYNNESWLKSPIGEPIWERRTMVGPSFSRILKPHSTGPARLFKTRSNEDVKARTWVTRETWHSLEAWSNQSVFEWSI
jgi:hypothetical protein